MITQPVKATEEKLQFILGKLRSDLLACECLLALISGATLSYRIDSVLRPFPPMFIVDGEKDIEGLRLMLKRIPKLTSIIKTSDLEPEIIDFLHWCLASQPFEVYSKEKPDLNGVHFQVDIKPTELQQRVFEAAKPSADSRVFSAFHGTKLENVFSILNSGLLAHMNKVGIFGSGTYLTTEHQVALHFTNSLPIWNNSSLGAQLRCVAICEVISGHPDVLYTESDTKRQRHDVPEKYILVKNNEAIRIKSLMFYSTKAKRPTDNSHVTTRTMGRLWSYLSNHKSLLLLVIYATVLLCINIPNSKPVKKLWSRLGLGSRAVHR